MFKKIEIHDVRCVRDVAVDLQSFHAFIGPNDSGKSTILDCVRAVCIRAAAGNSVTIQSMRAGASIQGDTCVGVLRIAKDASNQFIPCPVPPELQAEIGQGTLVRFDAGALRKPSGLLPESEQLRFLDERGAGLPGVYQAILSRGDDTFLGITSGLRRLFPTIKNLRVPAISHEQMVLEVELVDGQRIRADRISDGILYYLGFVALVHLHPVRVLLVEEPENGLHPARIRDVIRLLREVGKERGTQVLIATHSPLVVNELGPEEISVVTRPDLIMGTQVTPICATPNFGKRSSVYALGELWLSYADGIAEEPLLSREEGE